MNFETKKIRGKIYEILNKLVYFFIKNKYKKETSNKRIYHYHIRKTAGTSLNKTFLLALNDNKENDIYERLSKSFFHINKTNGKVFVGWNKFLIEKGEYDYAFSHLPAHSIELPQNTFTITVLRDPIERVISHYNMLKDYQNRKINHYCMKEQSKWLGSNFNDFLDNITKEHLLRQLYMFSEEFNVDEAFEKIINCSFYFFTENFKEGIDELRSILNIDLKNCFREKKQKNKFYPTEREMKKLRKMIQPEAELFNRLKKEKSIIKK